ncbi:hypothetical protein L0152_33180, partial [bacterium]|nr:hypothetical protein [bacterium]
GAQAYQQLLQIYQHEKEWMKAIECARELLKLGKICRGESVAQFYCELADDALRRKQSDQARYYLEKARAEDKSCLRAILILSAIQLEEQNYAEALVTLRGIQARDAVYIDEIVSLLIKCFRYTGNLNEKIDCLKSFHSIRPSDEINWFLTKLIKKRDGIETAEQFLFKEVNKSPTLKGIYNLITTSLEQPHGDYRGTLERVREFTSRLLVNNPKYRCSQCGFSGSQLHWRCPGCQHWESMKPVNGQ